MTDAAPKVTVADAVADEFIDNLINGWDCPAPQPRPAPPPANDIWVFQFGAGVYGGPWADRLSIPAADALALTTGTNRVGTRAKLLRRASVNVAGRVYHFAVYGARGSSSPDMGALGQQAFRTAIGVYRGSGGANAECYVVRVGTAGPMSFERDEPFLAMYFPGFA